jgi:hypothetical protein
MNRLRDYFEQEQKSGNPITGLVSEAFVECPAVFNEGLSPEEFKARQQLYRTAFERAQEQVRQETGGFSAGDGI